MQDALTAYQKRRTMYLMNKTSVIIIKVTPEQKATWQTAAEADARTLSSWVRVTLDAASKETNVG
jgi:uncharacterized protein (DUF1778 family)